jgi:hypothetical protein
MRVIPDASSPTGRSGSGYIIIIIIISRSNSKCTYQTFDYAAYYHTVSHVSCEPLLRSGTVFVT